MKRRTHLITSVLVVTCALTPAHAAERLTLERIMADPDWIGPPVGRPVWALGRGQGVLSLKPPGPPVRDLWRVPAGGGRARRVESAEMSTLDAAQPVFDRDRRR